MSIVAPGAWALAAGPFLWDVGGLREDDEGTEVPKAEDKTLDKAEADQVVVMLSGNWVGESMTKTSEDERRPRVWAEERSSFLRVGPRLSAFPGACKG